MLLLSAMALACQFPVTAQRAYIREKVRKDIEKKYEPEKQKGRSEIDKITYENDTRYKDPNNKVQATIVYEQRNYDRKARITTTTDKVVFGKHGEAAVMREGDKDEMWMVYDYAGKANYIVNVKDKTATKMPLINMKKMVEKMQAKDAARQESDQPDGWLVTDEKRVINGYNCTKYIYTYSSNPHLSTYEAWVSKEVKLNLDNNYLLGARISSYKFANAKTDKNLPNGTVVLGIAYDKKGKISSERELKSITKSADERYFDMSPFRVNDVVDLLN